MVRRMAWAEEGSDGCAKDRKSLPISEVELAFIRLVLVDLDFRAKGA